jgi:uncharacterized glyoxalase superfamily protein PhnB
MAERVAQPARALAVELVGRRHQHRRARGDRFTGCTIHLHVDDADAMAERAVAAGATMLMPPTDQFYGERSCRLRDPFGHAWLLGHSIEKVEPQEMQRRYTELMKS